MADIFLCYTSKDRELAERLADALKRHGWSVSWDWNLQFGDIIPISFYKELLSAQCVIVLWSESSIRDSLVLEVAKEALASELLAPILIEEIESPQAFRGINALDLTDWDGSDRDPHLQNVIDELERKIDSLLDQITQATKLTEEEVVGPVKLVVSDALDGIEDTTQGSDRINEESEFAYDENVQFTIYKPSEVEAGVWKTLLAFAHLSSARTEDEPDPLEEVRRQAEDILQEEIPIYDSMKVESAQAVPREGTITFQPTVAGIEFNPASRSFIWCEPVHHEEFRMRSVHTMVGKVARGVMSVWLGAILLAEINLTIRVIGKPTQPVPSTRSSASPYRNLFPSYSHNDSEIVSQFRHYAEALGDDYLQDVIALRSGEIWEPRINELIDSADIFQLFWSWNAMSSSNVEKEWRFALSLNRPNFLRPVFWESPRPEAPGLPPPELDRFNFHYIQFHTSELEVPDDQVESLILQVISYQREAMSREAHMVFGVRGGTIGRTSDNDWILPDTERYISNHHAVVSYRNGRYFLTDTSTNGVCVNDSMRPLGKDNRVELKDGDRLVIGDYEISVKVEKDLSTGKGPEVVKPLGKEGATDSPSGEDLFCIPSPFEGDHLPAETDLFQPPQSIPEDWDSTDSHIAGSETFRQPLQDENFPPSEPATPVALPKAGEADLLTAFLRGAQIHEGVTPPGAPEELMELAGTLLREIVEDLQGVLMMHSSLKHEFSMSMSIVKQAELNPLKLFTGDLSEAMNKLLFSNSSSSLPPEKAVQEVFQDIKDHQLATIVGMSAGISAVIKILMERFDPEVLHQRFEKSGHGWSPLDLKKKAKCWEQYSEFYKEWKEQAEEDLQDLFQDKFVRAYEEQIRKLHKVNKREKGG